MLKRRLCLLLAAAAAAAMLQPAPPGPVYATSHDAASNPGSYWVPGTVTTTKLWFHVNIWTQTGDGVNGSPGETRTDHSGCPLRGTTAANVDSEGCGHSRKDWT